MKLAIAQMVLGAIIVGNWLTLGSPWTGVLNWPGGAWRVLTMPWFTIFLVLGLAVLGCGIAQFLKARGSCR